MIAPEDILSAITSLAVTVAGFSGVVAALAPKRPWEWSPVAKRLFGALLTGTAGSAIISLLAMVLLLSPLARPVVWSVVSLVHGLYLAGSALARVLQGPIPGVPVTSRLTILFAAILVLAAVQFWNMAVPQLAWVCVGVLALHASLGFVYFIVLVHLLWRESGSQ